MAKEKQPEMIANLKHKVKFISTLYTYDFRFNAGEIVELTLDQYEIAKKHNSIKDIVNG